MLAATEPATGLATFFGEVVRVAVGTRAVTGLLADAGTDVRVGEQVALLRSAVQPLLDNGKRAGTVHPQVRVDEVLALLSATSEGAIAGGWTEDLLTRTLAVVFAGLRADR